MMFRFVFSNLIFLSSVFLLVGGGYYRAYGGIVFVVYLIVSTMFYQKNIFDAFLSRDAIPLYLFLGFLFLSNSFDIKRCISFFITFAPPLLFSAHIKIIGESEERRNISKMVICSILLFFCYFSIKSLLFLRDNPMGLRLLISSEKDESIIVGGGFALPYSLCILCPLITYSIKKWENTLYKCIGIAVVVIGNILVISSLYTTAILLLIVGYIYIATRNMKLQTMIVISTITIIIMLTIGNILPSIIDLLLQSEHNVVGRRLEELYYTLSGSKIKTEGDLDARITLTMSSMKIFFENPILGVGPSALYDFLKMKELGVGFHAQWFDIFAVYGLFAFLIVKYIANVSKHVFTSRPEVLLFIVLGFLNPCFYFTIMFVVYYLVPMINFLLSNEQKRTEII